MPAEPRRNSRKITSEEDIELKRSRGEISCAECRRLKLKCDKKLPCGSCVRRGCTSICPNGSLSAGQGTRFILADTEQLHRKISEMSERIRQLEDALAIFQSGVSNERHPLLRDELLTIKFGPEVRRTVDEEHTRDSLAESIDALGTLTIGDHGETKYFGRSGGSESLFLVGQLPEGLDGVDIQLDPKVLNLSMTFPLAIVEDGFDSIMDKLETYLPSQPRAWALCEAYIEHFTWWCRPIKRDEFVNDVMIPIYNYVKDPSRSSYHPHLLDANRCPHLLAVLFMVLAVGALVDLTLPPYSPEAEKYYRLGRAALSLRSVFDSPEIETVQAITLMAAYHSICTPRYSLESAWALTSHATKLAQSLGIHRDSTPWSLDDKLVQRRRNLFWELLVFEMIHCLALGRPPAVSLSQIDCQLPTDEEQSVSENGDVMQGYWNFKFIFGREVYAHVGEAMLSAKAPSYATILDLDRRIRQMALPPVKLYLRPDEDDYTNPSLCMKSYLMSHYRSITMIHIHRTFFAQALLDHPNNPLSSPYAPSVLAANRCASVLIKSFVHHHERCPELCARFWGMWTHAFSAAVILGCTVTRCPHVTMAPSALVDLDLAVSFFQRGANLSLRARQALPILRNLRDRATQAYSQYRNRHITPTLDIRLKIGPEDPFEDELAIFGGQTRVMSTKLLSRKRAERPSSKTGSESPTTTMHSRSASRSASTPASTPSDSGTATQEAMEQFNDVHPTLMEYLSMFPASSSFALVDPSQPALETLAAAGALPTQQQVQPQAQLPMQAQSGMQMHTLQGIPSSFTQTLPPESATPTQAPQVVQQQFNDISAFFGTAHEMPPMPTDMFGAPFVSGDVEMSEQWKSLMQETGIYDATGNFTGLGFGTSPNALPF
ncbi:hypothetical protein CERSUDRAFT_112795 [Gelatoporia subvermispora B]|uniref:Zn(2)-C6 fungal-type domain-containing protein n=1 Tax=Ceriporiopsis subvermispora (strain B) TaxID=914234 RepID=M2QPV9_CERS8|nr:hypothetical protein CERSUDRAFT_112795 [Gelatoporia subvermispora B]